MASIFDKISSAVQGASKGANATNNPPKQDNSGAKNSSQSTNKVVGRSNWFDPVDQPKANEDRMGKQRLVSNAAKYEESQKKLNELKDQRSNSLQAWQLTQAMNDENASDEDKKQAKQRYDRLTNPTMSDVYPFGAPTAVLKPSEEQSSMTNIINTLKDQYASAIESGKDLNEVDVPELNTSKDAGNGDVPESLASMGMSQEDWDKLEQGDQFRKVLENAATAQYYKDNYGIEGDMAYEQWRDDNYNHDQKHDLVRDLMGLGEDQSMAVPGWLDLYGNSGVNVDRGENNERDEQIIQDIMEYMWGADNIINPQQWLESAEGYRETHNLGAEGTADRLGQYMLENYLPGGVDAANYFNSDFLRDPETGESLYPGLDNKDLAAVIMAENMMHKDLSGYGQDNLDQIAAILAGAGHNDRFSFAPEGEEGYNWDSNSYNIANILDSTAALEAIPGVYGVNEGEVGVGSPVFASLPDMIMSNISRQTGNKINRN